MFRAALLLSLLSVLLAALALISCLSVADKREIRGLPRFVWVIVILLLPLAGPIAWFQLGRPVSPKRGGAAWRAATGFPTPSRPRAPDDDPDFLRSLDRRINSHDDAALREWQEDLHRREEERRRRDPGADS